MINTCHSPQDPQREGGWASRYQWTWAAGGCLWRGVRDPDTYI